MIDEIELLAFRAGWERRAFAVFLQAQAEERRDVEVHGRSGFSSQRWIAAFLSVWSQIADGWSPRVEAMLASAKVLTDEDAIAEELLEISVRKATSVVVVSEAEWTAVGAGVWEPGRLLTMAQTETAQATGWTQHTTALRSPLQLYKIWQSIIDDRTRQTHLDANGQRRLLNDPFDVGSAQLQWPADSGGPLEETINCRCWEDYELAAPVGIVA